MLVAMTLRCLLAASALLACTQPIYAEIAELYSPPFTVLQKYKSMDGPYAIEDMRLLQDGPAQLLWITGATAQVVNVQLKPLSADFFCHANLDLSPERHREIFATRDFPHSRLFTLSQGLTEIRLPKGAGIPVMSDEPLTLFTQALNHNISTLNTVVRVKVVIEFERASVDRKLTPLRVMPVYGVVLTSDSQPDHSAHQHTHPPDAEPGTDVGSVPYQDEEGRTYSGHWIVPPGTHVNRTRVTRSMALGSDTLIHYVAPHVHPFAQYIELRNVTTNAVVVRSNIRNASGRIGLEHVEPFSSVDGVLLKRSDQYELISSYGNTTQDNQTAMSVLFMYARDDEMLARLAKEGVPQ
jgi:hypothetical protein